MTRESTPPSQKMRTETGTRSSQKKREHVEPRAPLQRMARCNTPASFINGKFPAVAVRWETSGKRKEATGEENGTPGIPRAKKVRKTTVRS